MKAIAAMSLNRVIGAEGKIPWHLPEDLRFFKRATLGHIVLMGRKTYESLGKPLPGRENWVVSSRPLAGVRVHHHLDEIVEPGDGRDIFVIGGAQLYAALLPRCDELLLTLVKREVSGDVFFPPFEEEFSMEELLQTSDQFEIRKFNRRAARRPNRPVAALS
jgi:dihydrofolate reductase